MAARGYISYWWLPILSSCVWLGMLLAMLLWYFVANDAQHLPSQEANMQLPYISDIGAFDLQPLFIAGSAVTAATFDMAFAAERWLRFRGRLVPNRSRGEVALVVMSILFALVGTVGLVCLAVYDTYNHPSLHILFLMLFIGGYLISAIFICWEYQRLGIKNRGQRVLRISFWIKLAFVIVEFFLAVAFVGLSSTEHDDIASYLEWVVALIFTFYVLSFTVDLWPARMTKSYSQRWEKPEDGCSRTRARASLNDDSPTPPEAAHLPVDYRREPMAAV